MRLLPLKLKTGLFIRRVQFYEWAVYDSAVTKWVLGALGIALGRLSLRINKPQTGFSTLFRIHRSALSIRSARQVESVLQDELKKGIDSELVRALRAHADGLRPTPPTEVLFASPERILAGNSIVLKSWRAGERGLLLLYYSHVYPLFWRFFDVGRILDRYQIAIEPSWSGYCDPNVLQFLQTDRPVIVGATEPRDREFIERLNSNLIAAPFSSNSWTDDRVFRPIPGTCKDLDVVMVAGWGRYKRHWAFFNAVRRLRIRGLRLKIGLVGYNLDLHRQDVIQQATQFGVLDQLEFFEGLSAEEVNGVFNRAKVNVLWSRREGVNRALVEGMFAGIPCVVRSGFNYGYAYPMINPSTGRFATEDSLPDVLAEVADGHSAFRPRDWAMAHMSCQRSTALLNAAAREVALRAGEPWTTDLVAKINMLERVEYRNTSDHLKFVDDFDFLRACLRPSSAHGGR